MAERAHNTIPRHGSRLHRRPLPDHKPRRFHIPSSSRRTRPISDLILVSDRCFIQCRVKMALGRVWRVCSVWLFLTVTLTLGCQKLKLLQVLNTDTLGKLNEMGGPFPWQCVSERLSLKTRPLKLVNLSKGLTTQEKIHIVHQTLQQANEIYSMSLGSATWSLAKVEDFRVLLHRQVTELEECVWNPDTESRPKGTITIEKYFRKLRSFLKHKKFAECAWEIIRAETRACLQQILHIAAKTSRKKIE